MTTNLMTNSTVSRYCPDRGCGGYAQARAEIGCARCAELDAALSNVMDERDRYAELLDAMTAAVAAVTYRDFGEHSSANDPWRGALHALKGLEA